MLLLALQWAGIEYNWSSSVIIGLFVGFGLGIVVFVVWTLYRGEDALIPPRLFTVNRNPALIWFVSLASYLPPTALPTQPLPMSLPRPTRIASRPSKPGHESIIAAKPCGTV